ncbi:MAG TPA: DUF3105 domain-containing protein [Polyangia bacterium]|nr:DUF3105 domain-containing protein [Polyangia bacterium]
MRSTARWPAAAASARLPILAALALLAACGGSHQSGIATVTPPGEAGVTPLDGSVVVSDAGDGGACTTTIEEWPDEGFTHVSCMSDVGYQTEPPSSGNHYACWAAYQTYSAPIPWGNLVHSLEHGAIVIVYNCPDACPDDVAALQAFIDGLPLDSDCAPSLGKNRMILMPDPDPNLGARFAASAWDWTLRADCFDPVAFRQFFDAHYDHGREVICYDGWQPDQLCSDVCP